MKRIIFFILAFAMCMSLCACGEKDTPAPTEPRTTITVHAQVPAGWSEPGCWAWSSSSGEDVFDAWPGKAMAHAGEWYTIELPNWVNYVIINGNAGFVQTADLPVDPGKDIWVVVVSPENATVYYEEPAIPEVPTQPESISPEELFAALGTLEANQITDSKAVTCVYEIEDGQELSKMPVLDYLAGEQIAEAPEEVRYIVNIKYCAKRATNYIGPVKVFRCSITAEVVDVITGEIIAEETFEGADLPDQVVTDGSAYYGEYPDAALAQDWARDVLKTDRAQKLEDALETVQTRFIGYGNSYADILENLYRYGSFTAVEARYAADHCGADWNEEAKICAKSWLERGDGYSPQQLIDTLVNISGFTNEQATYGMENCGADWNAQALAVAKSFLEYRMGYSYSSMILVLTGDYGFTENQAEYAASNCGADWNQVAVDHVELFLEYSDETYTRARMIEEMVKYYGFTEEQAIYAVEQVGLE